MLGATVDERAAACMRLRHKPGRFRTMMTILGAARGCPSRGSDGYCRVAVTAMSHGRAEALSLASPAGLPSAKYASEGDDDRGARGGHGGITAAASVVAAVFVGGGGFHGGGIRGGGIRAYHGGGFARRISIAAVGIASAATRCIAMPRLSPAVLPPPALRPPALLRALLFLSALLLRLSRCRMVWTYYGPRRSVRSAPLLLARYGSGEHDRR